MTDWYDPTGAPVTASSGSSATMRSEFTAVQSGISNKLPALTGNADKLVSVNSGASALEATITITTAGKNLIDDASASDQRTTLGLGTAATQSTGTSGTVVPLLDGSNTWSAAQGYGGAPDSSAEVTVTSTTKGFLPPRMTTAQKNAISSPSAGLFVYDSTLGALSVYTSSWLTLGTTSSSFVIKTTTYTAVNGDDIMADTSGGTWTLTLPSSPSAGNTVKVTDPNDNWASNNLTVGRNGENIDSAASDFTCDFDGLSIEFVYVDSTVGWRSR